MREKTQKRIGISVTALLLAGLFIAGLASTLSPDPFYRNYWGGLVFGPTACLLAVGGFVLLYYAARKDGSRRKPKLRGRAARRARQAAKYRSPIDDYDRPWRGGV